jgi:hypothetical protein
MSLSKVKNDLYRGLEETEVYEGQYASPVKLVIQ